MSAVIEVQDQMLEASNRLKHHIENMKHEVSTIPMLNEMALNRVGHLFSEAKNMEQTIDGLRKQANAPYQQLIKATNARAEEIVAPLKEIQRMANEKTAQYHRSLEESRQKEQNSLMQAASLLDISDADMPLMSLPQEPLRSEATTMVTKTIRKWKIKDETQVPLNFYKLDEEKIDKVIKAGLDIPGIEIYEEKQTHLRRR